MNLKHLTSILAIPIIVAGGIWLANSYLARNPDQGASLPSQALNEAKKLAQPVRVTFPVEGGLVTSPLVVRGEARGYWFFEGSFPVKLYDATNALLATGIAQTTTGEWMTENFVPFEASLTFTLPSTQVGTLVLERDNPSGLPEYDQAVSLPVRFR